MRRSAWVTFVLGMLAASGAAVRCLSPTEITLVITTDIPCASLDGVAIVIGPPGELETRDPITVTHACDGDEIGTLVVTPSGGDGPVGIAVIAGTHGSPDVAAEACRAQGYKNCVVARRELSFITHTPLTLPIELSSACENFTCPSDPNDVQTCVVVDGKPQCAGALISDPTTCSGAGSQCEPPPSDADITDAAADVRTDVPTTLLDAGVPPGALNGVVAGGNSSCAFVTSTNNTKEWWCWGQNDKGQLAFDSSGVAVLVAHHVTALDGFGVVSIGINHGCGVNANFGVECWGDNTSGQLGDGTNVAHTQPASVANGLTTTDVHVGDDFSCGLAESGDAGAVTCWGADGNGQLASSNLQNLNTPGNLLAPFDQVATGGKFACAKFQGAISCWGDDTFEQIDKDATTNPVSTPYATGITTQTLLALGSNHACAANGSVLECWGDNSAHQSSPTSDASTILATPNVTNSKISGVTAGALHTCILVLPTADGGNVRCLGDNTHGQIGNGGGPVNGFTSPNITSFVSSIAAGYEHTCVVSAGAIDCWGSNASGQLGDGTTADHNTPAVIHW